MFTGLIEDIGEVERLQSGAVTDMWIRTGLPVAELSLGESISVDGTCLTVVEFSASAFKVQASQETLARTTLGELQPRSPVNLERALRLSDRLGGHLVSGHVDAVGQLVSTRPVGDAQWVELAFPEALAPLLVEKGSVAVDGVSLTVNGLSTSRFDVVLIPETRQRTALGRKRPGARVNLEMDLIGKYVARLMEARGPLSREAVGALGFFGQSSGSKEK